MDAGRRAGSGGLGLPKAWIAAEFSENHTSGLKLLSEFF
jgi:hypothetical protein